MKPVNSNALLTAIKGEGFAEDYRTAESADTTRWSGESPCYVREVQLTNDEGNEVSIEHRTDVLIDGTLAAPEIGDNITYTWLGSATTRKVKDIEPFVWDTMIVGYRLYLEP